MTIIYVVFLFFEKISDRLTFCFEAFRGSDPSWTPLYLAHWVEPNGEGRCWFLILCWAVSRSRLRLAAGMWPQRLQMSSGGILGSVWSAGGVATVASLFGCRPAAAARFKSDRTTVFGHRQRLKHLQDKAVQLVVIRMMSRSPSWI